MGEWISVGVLHRGLFGGYGRRVSRWLWVIILLSLGLRLGYVVVSEHTFYADEVFQSLEQGYRVHRGYGLLNWEFVEGVRHPMIPLVIGGALYVFDLVGWSDPGEYVLGVRVVFVLVSMSMVWAGYVIGRKVSGSERMGLWVAGVWGLGWEWVYFAGRPFYEVVASYLILVGVACLWWKGKRWQWIAGLVVGYAGMIRPQYVVLWPGVWLTSIVLDEGWGWKRVLAEFKKGSWRAWLREWRGYWIGIGGAVVIAGMVDWWFWGEFGSSFSRYVWPNLGRGYDLVDDVTSVWVEPMWFYIKLWIYFSGGLVLFAFRNFRKYWYVWVLIGSVLLPHSLIGHKEYRFVFFAWPLVWLLIVLGLEDWLRGKNYGVWFRNMVLAVVMLIWSVLGWRRDWPGQEEVFQLPLVSRYTQHMVYQELGMDGTVCGVFDASQVWMVSGGYFYLGREIPLYHTNYAPESLEYVNVVLSYRQESVVEGFDLVERVGGLGIYRREGGCVRDLEYRYEREV